MPIARAQQGNGARKGRVEAFFSMKMGGGAGNRSLRKMWNSRRITSTRVNWTLRELT